MLLESTLQTADSKMERDISAAVNCVHVLSPTPTRLCQISLQWTIMSTFVPTTSIPSPQRSARPLAARKQNDPTWFSTNPTSVTSAKRQAVERVQAEPRHKRKRVEPTLQTTSQLGHRVDKLQDRQNNESPVVSFVLLYCHLGAIPPNHDLSTRGLLVPVPR